MFVVIENFPRAVIDVKVPLAMNKNIPACEKSSHLQMTRASNNRFTNLQMRLAEFKSDGRTISRLYIPARPSIHSAEGFLKNRCHSHFAKFKHTTVLIQLGLSSVLDLKIPA